jgi:hypothetical protein
MPDPLESRGVPAEVAAALNRLRDELLRAAGTNLAGLLLYGGLARGRYRPGKSDVNVVVLLRDVSARSLAAIAPALRAAWRAVRVEPFLLTPDEVRLAADVFPDKFLDIKEHHLVLTGEDPFAQLEIAPEHLRLRVEQALRNLALRFRRRYLVIGDDPAALTLTLADLARPFALELGALLRLAGKEAPAEDRTAALFEAAAQAFELDREALLRLADLRAGTRPGEGVSELAARVLESMRRAADVADQLKVP